jgi:platelet-activating factor acetylhydrolase IB subunit beta/gamma
MRHPVLSTLFVLTGICLIAPGSANALEYAAKPADPQPTGWPLTPEEEAFVLIPEHQRRPGAENNPKKYLPKLWPVVPICGNFGGRSYLAMHESLVKKVQANKGPCDVLLVGDSITIQWESDLKKNNNWAKQFPAYKGVNIGIGGDKTYNVLWRLDHGGADGLEPRCILLMIGNNNMFFTGETGIDAAAQGIKTCVDRLREQFPKIPLILVKILPCHAPGNKFYEDIKLTNAALDTLKLTSDPLVQVLDIGNDFLNANGTIKAELFADDHIHPNKDGYAVYAAKLRPLLDKILGKGASLSPQ